MSNRKIEVPLDIFLDIIIESSEDDGCFHEMLQKWISEQIEMLSDDEINNFLKTIIEEDYHDKDLYIGHMENLKEILYDFRNKYL